MLVLYHNDMSLCAQKVRLCLAEKGLAWESRHLVLRAGEHQQDWYRKLNRRAVVPTLIDGDKVIPESNVILDHPAILDVIGERHRVADWYRRCKGRPSFHEAIVKWENADYLALMQRRGPETWSQIAEIGQAM